MSLVVAQLLDDGAITMLGDTKLLYEFNAETEQFNEARSRQVYQAAFPKIVILRHDLAVGIAGSGLAKAVEALVSFRSLGAEDLLQRLLEFDDVEFIVAALDPVRLWRVRDGQIDDRRLPRRAWAGDEETYGLFRQLGDRNYPPEFDQTQRCLASMQTLVHTIQPVTVGGYVIHLVTGPDGFRFSPAPARIAPSHLVGDLRQGADGTIQAPIVFPPGLDTTVTELTQLVGKAPTRGALALYVPPARTAWFFTEERPWDAIPLHGDSAEEVIRAAAILGQRVSKCGCSNDDH